MGGDASASRERARCIRGFLYPKPDIDVAAIESIEIPGTEASLPARVVRPRSEPIGTVVFFHGGGWVLGDLDSHEAHCTRIAAESGVVVLNVGYRLAPEHAFPAAAQDAMTALRWAARPTLESSVVRAARWRWPATVPAAISLRWRQSARAMPVCRWRRNC